MCNRSNGKRKRHELPANEVAVIGPTYLRSYICARCPTARLHILLKLVYTNIGISAKYNIILINNPDFLPDLPKGGGMIFDTDSML